MTRFALEYDRTRAPGRTNASPVHVTIEGSEDTAAWLLSKTQVRLPAADDPRWRAQKPTTFDLSEDDGVKRVVLWRKLADGTVSTRPEVATIELSHQY